MHTVLNDQECTLEFSEGTPMIHVQHPLEVSLNG